MAAFDRLPKPVQDAIRNSPVYLGTERILVYHKSNGTAATLKIIAKVVADWQAKNPIVEGPKR